MTPIQDLLTRVKMAEPIVSGSLFLWPLLIQDAVESLPILTLDEALARDLADVSEVSGSGSVPELMVTNRSDRMLFLLDGEQVLGAKQNRTFNLSMLIPPASRVRAPVSCLEQGRWRMATEKVRSAEHVHFAQGRAGKMRSVSESLLNERRFSSDQSEVWANVSARFRRASATSSTMAEADYYSTRRSRTNIAVEQLVPAPTQAGAVYGIGDRIVGVELFASPDLFAKLAPKVARSYILDAIETEEAADAGIRLSVELLLDRIFTAQTHAFAAPGAGESLRFGGDRLTGAALVDSDRCIHLAAFCDA